MTTQTDKILSGKALAEKLSVDLENRIARRSNTNCELCLATVQMDDSPDTQLYSKSLARILSRFKIHHIEKKWKSNEDVRRQMHSLFDDPKITGILVFSPIPQIVASAVFVNLPRQKDVEGRTFSRGNPFGVFSPTAKAAMALLKNLQEQDKSFVIKGKHAVMVGHSDLVGKPTAMLLSDEGATVTVCHKDTQNIQKYISDADILVVAIGKPGVIQSSWIKKGAVVIDVGENVVDGKLVGDVDLVSAINTVSYISPVPGGVGPLTNLMVIDNLLKLDDYKDALDGSH